MAGQPAGQDNQIDGRQFVATVNERMQDVFAIPI